MFLLQKRLQKKKNIVKLDVKNFCAENDAIKKAKRGSSQTVQGLRLRTSTEGGEGSIPGQGIEIPHAMLWALPTPTPKKVKRQSIEWEEIFANHVSDKWQVFRADKRIKNTPTQKYVHKRSEQLCS